MKKVSFIILFLLLLSGHASALTVTLMDSAQGFSQSLIGSIFFDSETFPAVDTTYSVNGTAVESEDDSDALTAVAGENILRPPQSLKRIFISITFLFLTSTINIPVTSQPPITMFLLFSLEDNILALYQE